MVAKLYLCSLCGKEYPKNVELCPLEHCKFCGDTSLEIIQAKFVKDPIFILINTLFAMLLAYGFFQMQQEFTLQIIIAGTIFYIFGLVFYLGLIDKKSRYYCKNCRTTIGMSISGIKVGEYETKPEKKQVIQSLENPKSHHVKELIMILGAIGSVISFIIILMQIQ